ncbi:MAG TPA: hypothetical protein VME46_03040 [Acidimicrobiales bacterium]|nr:hypothetical protein [Acidimicrobiales bacterium]
MGAWGTGIFQEDIACDVRIEFRELIGAGVDAEDATERLRARYLDGAGEGTATRAAFWLALALTQWKTGRLLEAVKAEALRVIDEGADLDLWRPEQRAKRAAVLAEAKERLLSTQKTATRIRRRILNSSPFQVGDIVIYTSQQGRQAAFWVIANDTFASLTGESVTPVLQLLSVARPTMPPLESLVRGIPARRRDHADQFCQLWVQDGADAIGAQWETIGNLQWREERFAAIGQDVRGRTSMFAKRPTGKRLQGTWVEVWLESWYDTYGDLLDHNAIIDQANALLGVRASAFEAPDEATPARVADLRAYLVAVVSRLRAGQRLGGADLDEWLRVTELVGADREHPRGPVSRRRRAIEELSDVSRLEQWLKAAERVSETDLTDHQKERVERRRGFLEAQFGRAESGSPPSYADVAEWLKLMQRSPRRGDPSRGASTTRLAWYITSVPQGAWWDRLKAFDADFFDFLRWDAASGLSD